jgi:hypothetical protein
MAEISTDKYLAAEARLAVYLKDQGEPVQILADWILALRAAGRSDRDISDRMYAATGVSASHETIRNWFPHARADADDDDLVGVGGGA